MTNPVWSYLTAISSVGGDLGITHSALTGGSTPSSGAFPASNDALFVPVVIKQTVLIKRLFSLNGATASGNIDVGIYSEDGSRIVSSGSTAQSGTSIPQFFDITDLVITPGRYYFAVAMNNTTGTLFRVTTGVIARFQCLGLAKQATAFALPATATFATITAVYFPVIGAEVFKVL
jgi:hypothetical protein